MTIVVRNLVKRYVTFERRGFLRRVRRVVEALRGVSFEVRKGEVFGLLGPNGAGKTTTVKIITTLLLPDDGRAWVEGYDVVEEPRRVREVVGAMLSVERGFFWKLTGRENLLYFGMLRGLSGRELKKRVDELLELVGLKQMGAADKLFEEYSLGMRARLALARALLHDPSVLVLDEPTLGLDPASARDVRKLLRDLAREGKTILLTTHNMFEAEIVCDRVAIIDRGRIVAVGTVPELKRKVVGKTSITIVSTPLGNAKSLVERSLSSLTLGLSIEQSDNDARIRFVVDPENEERALSTAIELLAKLGARVRSVRVEEPTLEDVFILLTKRGEGT